MPAVGYNQRIIDVVNQMPVKTAHNAPRNELLGTPGAPPDINNAPRAPLPPLQGEEVLAPADSPAAALKGEEDLNKRTCGDASPGVGCSSGSGDPDLSAAEVSAIVLCAVALLAAATLGSVGVLKRRRKVKRDAAFQVLAHAPLPTAPCPLWMHGPA